MFENFDGYSTPIFPAGEDDGKDKTEFKGWESMFPPKDKERNEEVHNDPEEPVESTPETRGEVPSEVEPAKEIPAPATEATAEEAPAEEAAAPNAERNEEAHTAPEEPAEEPAEALAEESAEVPAEVPAVDPLAPVLAQLTTMNEQLEAMNQLFVKRIARTEAEEKITDQMHAELQRYKDDLYTQLIRPVLLDIIELRDSILRISAVYAEKPEGEQDIPLRMFSDYALSMLDILEKYNVFSYKSNAGDDLKPIRMRAIKKVPTGDETLHGKVAKSLGFGYEYTGKVITPEPVEVYVFDASLVNSEDGAN